MTMPSGSRGGHVLGRMHGDVDRAGKQRLVDLLGEQAFAAGLDQRPVGDAVAGGTDGDDQDRCRPATDSAAASRARVSWAWASASGLPRVPMRI